MSDGKTTIPKVAGIATLAQREELAKLSIPAIARCVDKVYVCFSGYTSIPKWAYEISNVIPEMDPMNVLHDTAKLLWTQDCESPSYYFCCDDDLEYLPGYFDHLLFWLRQYRDRALVGLHGRGFNYEDKINYCDFGTQVPNSTRRPILGTGACAFHTGHIQFHAEDFYDAMANADYIMGLKIASLDIPGYVIPRDQCLARAREHDCLSGSPSCGKTRKKNPIVKMKRKSMDNRIKWQIFRHKENLYE